MKKKRDNASICIAGLVTGNVKRSQKSNTFDMTSKVPGGDLTVHVRVPATVNVEENTCAIVFDAKIYKSVDNAKSDFALNVPHDGIVFVDEMRAFPRGCISLIGDVASQMRESEDTIEFVVSMETATKPVFIHIIVDISDKASWILQKGDKVGVFGGTIERIEKDKNSSFAVRVGDRNVHLIPFYDGEQEADSL